MWMKPAWLSRFWSSWAARAVVSLVAPGQRGWVASAMRPPGRSRVAQVVELFGGVGPEPDAVDGEDGVEWSVEARQLVHRCPNQLDALLADGGGIALGRLVEHQVGVVDAVDPPFGDVAGEFGDGETGA